MEGKITLTFIKPDIVRQGKAISIMKMIEDAGFKIIALKMIQLSREQAREFYIEHKEKSFYKDLVEYMCSGPVIAMLLEKDNAVADFRKLIGATNPANAEKGTIRNLFGKSIQENAIHGSDSDKSALREGGFFFSYFERYKI